MRLLLLLALALTLRAEPFALRGYYVTFMRMPAMELAEWKQSIDCFADDGVNVVVLWTAGGFRSKKFPITWEYNRDHANVTNDFVGALIDYAHTKKMRVLLGFTPFGYDGVNRYPIEHPELKAKKADGSAVDEFGIHCWGWNLCAAQEESQRFMREYISEMCFDFYPNADGLLIESSDYNICRCKDCGPKYYDNEFKFVRWISDEVWKRNKDALILVYPHYFSGKKVPGFDDVKAARQEFDPRWALSFSPHSSHFDDELIKKARASFYWSDAPILGTPRQVAEAARAARAHGVTGFMPSMEAFSYVAQHIEGGEPWWIGKRKKPFGLDVSGPGKSPYTNIIARLQRFAFREFSQNPDLSFETFESHMAQTFFGDRSKLSAARDLIDLEKVWVTGSDWYWSSPILDPDFFFARSKRLKWDAKTLTEYDAMLAKLKKVAQSDEIQLAQPAREVVTRWGERKPSEP